ncbi:hypothetical protein Daus18300_003064 [Diaporthe australafricana]|uniref:Rhodopsin domain-containing protein n=1 Tax=Diaporthe australafricana TaxID=127596 RepID=A0ABR3XIU9_9PEZI
MELPPHDHAIYARWQSVSNMPSTQFQRTMLAVLIFWTLFALAAYCLRMYSRVRNKQLGAPFVFAFKKRNADLTRSDDWLISAAMIFSVAQMVYTVFRYSYVGFPKDEIPLNDPSPGLFWEFLMEIFYNPILALVKSSVLVFLLRIGGCKSGVRRAIHIVNVVNLAEMIALFLVVIMQSIPIQAAWDLKVKATHQIEIVPFIIATAAITIATDVVVLAIPVWVFIGLNMRKAQKIGILLIFLAGGVVTAVSIVRLTVLLRSFSDPTFDYINSWGPAYAGIETNLAIVTASVPALRPLFAKWMPQYFRNNSSGEEAYPNTESGRADRSKESRITRADRNTFQLKDMGETHTEIRGYSPDGSEEEIMTYNGIVRTTQVSVSYGAGTPELEPTNCQTVSKNQ